jgi:hypothetical protein
LLIIDSIAFKDSFHKWKMKLAASGLLSSLVSLLCLSLVDIDAWWDVAIQKLKIVTQNG